MSAHREFLVSVDSLFSRRRGRLRSCLHHRVGRLDRPRVEAGRGLLVDVREDAEWAAPHAPRPIHIQLGVGAARLDDITREAQGRPGASSVGLAAAAIRLHRR